MDVWFLLCFILASTTEVQSPSTAENITTTPSTATTENITTTPSTANPENTTTTPSTANPEITTPTPSTATPEITTTTPSTATTEITNNTAAAPTTSTMTPASTTTNTMSTNSSTASSAAPTTTTTSTSSSTASSAASTITTTPSTATTENITTTPSTATTEITTTPSTANTENTNNTAAAPTTSTMTPASTTTNTMSTSSITASLAAPTTTTISTSSSTASSAASTTNTTSTSSSTASSAASTTNTTSTSSSTASSAASTTNTTSTSSSTASSAASTTNTTSTSSSTASSAASTTNTMTPASTTTNTMSTSSSTASSAAPTRPPPVVCHNGGLLLDGVCLCADDWSGDTCSEENFCKAETLNGLNFPSTPVGWFSYSEEFCLEGSGAGKPRAATRCSNNNGSLGFQRPQLLQCHLTLSDILQNITTVKDSEMLATSAQILTSRPEELTAENVTSAAEIANLLLLSPNITESVRISAVATVSQLLNASVLDDTEENNATLNLTQTLDELSLTLRSDPNTLESQVVQPNLVVQSARVNAADTRGVQFTSLTGTSGSFVSDRIQMNTNTSTVVVENGFIADALIHVQFAPEAADRNQEQSHVSLGFVLYQNNRFFRSSLYKARHATVRVLSASVRGQKHRVVPQRVEMMFRPTLRSGTSLYDFACVSWNYTLNDWSTTGCAKGNASDGAMRCICSHTTNFAALLSFIEIFQYAEDLGLTSICGLSLSILGLVVTIIHLIKDKESLQDNQEVKIALLSICSSLLGFIITFLSGAVQSERADAELPAGTKLNVIPPTDQHVEQERISCTTVAFLLHFSLLATFTWISVYGHLMMKLSLRSQLPGYWTKLSYALGWGLPAGVVAITMAVTYTPDNPQRYRQEEFCWLAALDKNKHFDFGKPMFWGLILPGTLIIIYNLVILTRISQTRCRKRPCPSSSSFPLAASVALSCAFGYVVLGTTGRNHTVFSVLLCISAITLGFLFFILFTAMTPSFRSSVSGSVKYVSSVKMTQVNIQLSSRMRYNLRRHPEKSTSQDRYRSMSEDTYVTTQL